MMLHTLSKGTDRARISIVATFEDTHDSSLTELVGYLD